MATVGRTSMAITGSVTSGTKQSGSPELPIGEDGFYMLQNDGPADKTDPCIGSLPPSLPPGKAAVSLWGLEPLQ